MADPVILINSFEVPAADADAFVAAWEKARDHLRSQPGYLDTVLHQAITPDAEFQFVNVARWRTAEDFTTAAQSPGFGESAAGLARYRPHPALYRPVRTGPPPAAHRSPAARLTRRTRDERGEG